MLHHPVVVSQNVGCFLRLSFEELAQSLVKHVNKYNSGVSFKQRHTPLETTMGDDGVWICKLPCTYICVLACMAGTKKGRGGKGEKSGKGKAFSPQSLPFCYLATVFKNSQLN